MARSANPNGSMGSHRFAADPRIRVFDRIAWIYRLLFHAQRRAFRRTFPVLLKRLNVPPNARILDVGCGNGACISVLAEMGYEVWAVDASPRMLAAARRLLRNAGLETHALRLSTGDPLKGLEFPDRYFDLVLASHVVHGLRSSQRRQFYGEAKRVSRRLVLFYDYSPRWLRGPGLFTRVLEALERSDYRRFRRSGLGELKEFFPHVEVLAAAPGSAWYIGYAP